MNFVRDDGLGIAEAAPPAAAFATIAVILR
jgi:hypothetical protein